MNKNVTPIKVKSNTNENQNIDEKTKKIEKLIIYLLINYPDKSYEKLKNIITNNLIKIEMDKEIFNKLNEEYEKGNINTENILDFFEDENTINYLSGIMSSDFEINDIDKCIEDIIIIYRKELLIQKRNDILNKIEKADLTKEEIASLEAELNNIIIKLAKMK